ncbi:MAG: PDDEXK nuclease domain-containing protein [Candidatus Kapabacteria bacterium]|nr:PDDEXK nuclease domain-containing protein [Candidatus Kapabacteria bacterium]
MNNYIEPFLVDFEHIVKLIEAARSRAYSKVNVEMIMLHFNVGKIVSDRVSAGSWGDKTVGLLAEFIQNRFPSISGFNRRGLYRMKQFFETYSEPTFLSTVQFQMNVNEDNVVKFVSTLLTQIQWSAHLHILSKTKTSEEKLFYLLKAANEKLSVREVERQLKTAVFERTMLANQIVSTTMTQLPKDLFKEPYIFEFLDLPEPFSENDLETALIKNLHKFILEIGKGFTYMGNQYRLQVGNKDYYTDLLFFHRDLQCLVLFELKISEFEPEFLGKLNFYLEALDRDVKRAHENPSIGVLLCKGKDSEVVEYAMSRNISPAMIADYETKMINKKVLADKFHQLFEMLSLKEENNG